MSCITKKQKVLNHLERTKKGITSWTAIRQYNATRLSDIIYDLKREGYDIQDTWERSGRTNYKRYWMV